MALTYYNIGTASVANGATTITFAGTLLGTEQYPNFKPGDLFMDPAQPLVPPQRIEAVNYTAKQATLGVVGWPGTSMVGAPYEVRYVNDAARSTAQTRRVLELLSARSGLIIAVTNDTTVFSSGAGKARLRAPMSFQLTEVRASLKTASTSGPVTIDININGASILSTKLTIDQGEKTSVTAAAPHVISNPFLDDDDEITVDIDTAGSNAVGLQVVLYADELNGNT